MIKVHTLWLINFDYAAESQNNLYNIGPKNITRYVGENNVFIPCPSLHQYLPIWKINESYYELYSLPVPFVPASRGIMIPRVTIGLNGTKLSCYYTTGNEIRQSSVGIFTVKWIEGESD